MDFVRRVGNSGTGMELFLSVVRDIRTSSPDLSVLPRPFVVITAFDSTAVDDDVLKRLARELILEGCRCSCTWGPDSARMDVAFDLAAIDAGFDGSSADEEFVMTSDHGDESLDEALWYALFVASPADPSPPARAVLALASPDTAPHVKRRFADVGALNREVVDDESEYERRPDHPRPNHRHSCALAILGWVLGIVVLVWGVTRHTWWGWALVAVAGLWLVLWTVPIRSLLNAVGRTPQTPE